LLAELYCRRSAGAAQPGPAAWAGVYADRLAKQLESCLPIHDREAAVPAALVHDLFRRVHREINGAFVIVTHDRTIAQRTDRIIEVRDGLVVQDVPNDYLSATAVSRTSIWLHWSVPGSKRGPLSRCYPLVYGETDSGAGGHTPPP
jgi:hypothetical protein